MTQNLTEEQYKSIYEEAAKAAFESTNDYVTKYPDAWYPCGFAWVKINPARGKFVSFLKKHNIGNTDSYYGGYMIYNPSGHNTQCMEAKKLGCIAFVEVIRKHLPEIKISYTTQID